MVTQKCRLRDAAHRYQYALKKLPTEADDDDVFDSDRNTFSDLRVILMLNLSRCKRKLKVSRPISAVTKDIVTI